MTGHWRLWQDQNEDREISFHYDINATHMFRDWRRHTFELKNRPNSAYMLVYRQEDGGRQIFQPLANISTLDVRVGIPIQVDAVAMLNMKLCGFSFDLGYNFWMRGCERMTRCDCDDTRYFGGGRIQGTWYLKGDAQMFAYGNTKGAYGALTYKYLNTPDPVALSVSQSRATIHDAPRGTAPIDPVGAAPTTGLTGGTQVIANSGVDNPVIAENPDAAAAYSQPGAAVTQHINQSAAAIAVTTNDLDFVRTRGLSHKIFGHLTYELDSCGFDAADCRPAVPFIGVGFFGEFGDNGSCNNNCTNICYNSCVKTSLSQWGIWLRGGISYK